MDPTLSHLVFSTYLGVHVGGDALTYMPGPYLALDGAGNIYISGQAGSRKFPTTRGAYMTTCPTPASDVECYSLFVTKLNPTGAALIYSTFVGGPDATLSGGLAVDAAGRAIITGKLVPPGYPVTAGAVTRRCLQSKGSPQAYECPIVTELTPDGSALAYSTILAGPTPNTGVSLGVTTNAAGDIYVTGSTGWMDFPTTKGVFQQHCPASGPGACAGPFVTVFRAPPSGAMDTARSQRRE